MTDFLVRSFIMMCFLVYFYGKLFAAADTDGQLKKTASASFLAWLDRRLK